MARSIREIPPVCLLVSFGKLLVRRLAYSNEYVGTTITMDNGEEYCIFRHITSVPQHTNEQGAVLLVNFTFARLSQKMNRFISQFPMLLITGFPGFQAKMYAVNSQNGHWLGLYQWESTQALEAYKQSFVLRMMNRRAKEGSVTYREIETSCLTEYIQEHRVSGK